MITRFTKLQLIAFAIITLLGTAYVGGTYAEVDRLVIDRTYPVTAKFEDSGGIFAGAQVTYRGIEVGKVGRLAFTDEGVDVILDIEDDAPDISADTMAIVANKSAIGEQFVDLQPRTNQAPFLAAGTVIDQDQTRIPIDTTTLLVNLNSLINSVDTEKLRTLVNELGAAFEGTGRDLQRIVDTQTDFIQTADENIEVTRSLIRSSQGVLQTQIDKQGELAVFSENLALLSDTLVESDADIRFLLDEGPSSAREVNQVVTENADDLRTIFSNLRIASEPFARNDKSLQVLSILYPYLLEGGFSVAAPSKGRKGEYDATFGLAIPPDEAKTCKEGYRERRQPTDLSDIEFNTDVDCRDEETAPPRTPSRTEISRNRTAVTSSDGEDDWRWLLLAPVSQ